MPRTDIKEMLKEAGKTLSNPDAIVDPADFKFLWVSENQANMHGQKPAEVIGKDIFTVCYFGSDWAKNVYDQIISGESSFKSNIPVKSKDGKSSIVEVSHEHFTFKNKPYIVCRIESVVD